MNVFALTLQTGPGTDVAAIREPISEGFDQSLKDAMVGLEGAVKVGEESVLPEVQSGVNLDLNALDVVNALSVAGMNPTAGMVLAVFPSAVPTPPSVADVQSEASATVPLITPAIESVSLITPESESALESPDLTLPALVTVRSVEVTRSESAPQPSTEGNGAPNEKTPGSLVSAAIPDKSTLGEAGAALRQDSVPDKRSATSNSPLTNESVKPAETMKPPLAKENSTESVRTDEDSLLEIHDADREHGQTNENSDRRDSNQAPTHSRSLNPGGESFGAGLDRSAGVRDALRSIADRIVNTVSLKPQGEVRIVLDSVELGTIMTTVQIDGQNVEAQIKVQDERLGMAMQAQRQELFQRIEARGLSLDSFHVGHENSDSTSNGQSSQEQFQEGQQRGRLIASHSLSGDASTSSPDSSWSPTTRWINTIA